MIHYPPLTHQETMYHMFVQGTESTDSQVMSFFLWPFRVLVLSMSYSIEIFLNRKPGERYYRFLSFFLGALIMDYLLGFVVYYPQFPEEITFIERVFYLFVVEEEVFNQLQDSYVPFIPLSTFLIGVAQHVFRRYNRIMISANPIHSQSHGKSWVFGWVRRFIKDEYQHQVFTTVAEPIFVIFIALILGGNDAISEEWLYLPEYLILAAFCLLFRRGIALSYERTQRLNLYDAQLQNIPTLKAYNQKSGMFNQEHSARRA